MAKLPLVTSPNPILKTKSVLVEKIDKDFQKFLDDLLETMYHEDGAGIAAVQVGVPKRVFILDMGKRKAEELKNPTFFINPQIIHVSDEKISLEEGCLSFPGGRVAVLRPATVKIKYLDYDGNEKLGEFDHYMARGVFHEHDHLDGITMPDRLSAMKRDIFLRQMAKHERYNKKKS